MDFKLFDSHCHLHFPQFDTDRAEVLARMQTEEMGAVLIGTDYETSKTALELAKRHDFLWASVGLHPNDNESESFDLTKYELLACDPKVVAIGECGLDYFRSKPEGQKERFQQQVMLAEKVGKALVVHCRDPLRLAEGEASAHDDMLVLLSEKKPTVPVIIHFFTGSGALAQKYIDLDCYLSFPGPVTYTDMYDDAIKLCPPERLLIETDAPFAAPVPYRGKRNEPVYVGYVAEKVAHSKGISAQQVKALAVDNAQRVFKYGLL